MTVEIGRKKATIQNAVFEFSYQLVMISFGFIIPRLFLTYYGPTIHGLTSSITNVMSYVLLLNAGLNTASIQALYDPLNKKDIRRLNEILNAIRQYYIQTGMAFTASVVLLALILPYFIPEVPVNIVFWLMLVMGMQSTLTSFLISKHTVLLQADQKLYVATLFNIVALVLRGVIQILLIRRASSVILVQAIPTIAILVVMLLQNHYVKRHYKGLDKQVKGDKRALSKRWSAFLHQIAGLVVNNTDILILTIVTGDMVLVSIYAVYQLVFSHLYSLMKTVFAQGSVASFGSLMLTQDREALKSNYELYEFLYFSVVTVIYSVTSIMILPFVRLYTAGANDVSYSNPTIALLFVAIGIANNLRVPGDTLINAGGYFKETQWRAMLEAAINLLVSLMLIQRMGIYGLLVGTMASFGYRTIDIILFSNRQILKQTARKTFYRAAKVILIVLLNVSVFTLLFPLNIVTWLDWILSSIYTGIFSVATAAVFSLIFEKKSYHLLTYSLKQMLKLKAS
ncbi:O-antigen flippase Wzx [Alkalibacterium sp. AK22]|nr:O-antigen flippase Wzx [Alkalibacterium sp. AK22]